MFFTALKSVIGDVIPEGYEPYSEFRPEEEISSLIGPSAILKRQVPSITITLLGNKVIVELKRALHKIFFDSPDAGKRQRMETLIIKVFDKLDPTKRNSEHYKQSFNSMTDAQFSKFFKQLFANEHAYLVLNICDYEVDLRLDYVEAAAKVLNVPLFERVAFRHYTMDKNNVILSKEPVPVGYAHVKRPQQTVQKKNGLSITADIRSSITGQVTGADKNGRQSDLENNMLTSYGMFNGMKELNGPRADDAVMKQQMYQEINNKGYVSLSELESDTGNKTTLCTVDTYLIGMGLKSDLVTPGLMLKKTIREEM